MHEGFSIEKRAGECAWPSDASVGDVRTVVRAELIEGPPPRVRILRELACGEETATSGEIWSRTATDVANAADLLDAVGRLGERLTLVCEMAMALPPAAVDASLDLLVEHAAEERRAAEAEEERKRRAAEKKARRAREIAVYFTGERKRLVLEMRRGPTTPAFLKLKLGAEWERDRVWDWLKWQDHRFEAIEADVASRGEEAVLAALLAEMLETETRVKKRGHGAGGRRPLLFWRGDR